MEQCRSKKGVNESRGYCGRTQPDTEGDPYVLRLGETQLPMQWSGAFARRYRFTGFGGE